MTSAKIIRDSISPEGKRLITLECTYPRYIHAEVMTHRLFSRNVSSSRAIPVDTMISRVHDDPVVPIFMMNQKGMQADVPMEGIDLNHAEYVWGKALESALLSAKTLSSLGVHKQVANRVLEPFAKVTSIISSTEWDNFFKLRLAPDAQQEIQLLAQKMKEAIDESRPDKLSNTEWHLPYISVEELEDCLAMGIPVTEYLVKVSAARCARVSYVNSSSNRASLDVEAELFDRLVKSGHMSPLEHVAKPDLVGSGNFVGWTQLRKQYQGKL